MPFTFSFSSSATIVSTSSINGETRGWAYKHESYRTSDGSGARTTRQTLGQAPVTQMNMYDAQGRPLLVNGGNNNSSRRRSSSSNNNNNNNTNSGQRRGTTVPVGQIISIEDVTEEEDAKAASSQQNC